MKKRKSKEAFFEVFRRQDESDKPQAWWMKKSDAVKAKAAGESKLSDQGIGGYNKGRSKRDITTPAGRVVLTFSHEALLLLVFVGVVLMIVSHVWGYKRGVARNRVLARTGAQQAVVGEPRALTLDAPAKAEPPFFSVRVISGISQQSAMNIRADLMARGYDAFIYKERSGLTVNVGRFESNRELSASGLKLKLAPDYPDCYAVKISDADRIVER